MARDKVTRTGKGWLENEATRPGPALRPTGDVSVRHPGAQGADKWVQAVQAPGDHRTDSPGAQDLGCRGRRPPDAQVARHVPRYSPRCWGCPPMNRDPESR